MHDTPDLGMEEFGARVLQILWNQKGGGPDAVRRILVQARPELIARLDPDRLFGIWESQERYSPHDALRLLPLLPDAVGERIVDARLVEAFRRLRTDQMPGALGFLTGTARESAEDLVLQHWTAAPHAWLQVVEQLPEDFCARVPKPVFLRGWAAQRRGDPRTALIRLARLSDALHAHLPADTAEALVERDAVQPGDPSILFHLAELPARYTTPKVGARLREVLEGATREGPGHLAGVMRAVSKAPPELRAHVPPEEMRRMWEQLSRAAPILALELLPELSEEHRPHLAAEEVQRLWKRATQASPRVADLGVLSRIPLELRPWADARLVRKYAEHLARHADCRYALEDLAEVAPDLQAHFDETLLRALLLDFVFVKPALWLQQQGRRAARGEPVWTLLVREGFRACAGLEPQGALFWLAEQDDATRGLIPHEIRMAAWRLWVSDPPGASVPVEMGAALEWAGVDPDAHALATTGDGLVAPAELRPADLEAELRSAVLEAVDRAPAKGFQLLENLPEPLRPSIERTDLQALWTSFLEASRGEDALALFEQAPEVIRPVPSTDDIARLLQSGSAAVRLGALRLAAHVPDSGATPPMAAPEAPLPSPTPAAKW
jgi:hypothetical protein